MTGAPWMPELQARIEDRLRGYLEDKRSEANATAPASAELVDAIAALTLRGGKRMRPKVVAAALRAVDPDADTGRVVPVGAAIEMLQSYLLIHDDWMDLDDERRGGPSVWASLRDRHGDPHLGASLAVLAGDLASAYATELLLEADFGGHAREALSTFLRIQREVFFGQHLDLIATPEVERMYDLKTGSYTVRGPLRLGALLGHARPEQLAALDRFAAPLGVAFQIRDELLGTFGDPKRTGKPAGNDLRAGKHTVLVKEARSLLGPDELAPLEGVLGRADASEAEIAAATHLLRECGAASRVESRLENLRAQAEAALADAPLDPEPLRDVARRLANRDH